MGCGTHIKAANDMIQKPTPRPQAPVTQSRVVRTHNTRNKLDREVLDGFEKIIRAFYVRLTEKPKPISPLTHPQMKGFPESQKSPLLPESTPFQDLLKSEQSEHDQRIELKPAFEDPRSNEENRRSPEPPRPESLSDEQESGDEKEDMKNERMEKERVEREAAERRAAAEREEEEKLAASRKGKMNAMAIEADSIMSKYQ